MRLSLKSTLLSALSTEKFEELLINSEKTRSICLPNLIFGNSGRFSIETFSSTFNSKLAIPEMSTPIVDEFKTESILDFEDNILTSYF